MDGISIEKIFGIEKDSLKTCLKYGVALGIASVFLAVLNSLMFIWLGLFEPVLVATENNTLTETLIEGANYDPTTFIISAAVLAIISFIVTFAIIFLGLKKILEMKPEENKVYSGIYILGISLIFYFIAASLLASEVTRPHGLLTQVLAMIFAIAITKPKINQKVDL